ncbi:MAG: hypothetical protein ACT4NV_00030 [Rhodoferax sp.]
MSGYLRAIHAEAVARGYAFDATKIQPGATPAALAVTSGQVAYEWSHLMAKLQARKPELFHQWNATAPPEVHPLFTVHAGAIASWERL